MKTKFRTMFMALLGAAGLTAAGLLSTSHQMPVEQLPVDDFSRSFVAVGSAKINRLYEQWVKRHEKQGGDHNVTIALGSAKGLSEPGMRGHGFARLDLVAGKVKVEVSGLAKDQNWEVWLLDDRVGSALVEEGDALIRLGALQNAEGRARLHADLGSRAFEDFEVDAVLVTRAEKQPSEPAALYGMPTAFQRLYTKARHNRISAYLAELGIQDSPTLSPIQKFAEIREANAADTIVDPDVLLDPLVAFGADVFINQTFDGNGRTCATCHPPENNFTIDQEFISQLPPSDPLFVAETNPDLEELEVPILLRELGLIVENVDGFDNPGVLRSVPHTLAMSTSLSAPTCVDPDGCVLPGLSGPTIIPFGGQIAPMDLTMPEASGFDPIDPGPPLVAFPLERTGWGGDGAPGSGTLREFSIGAVFQHFPLTLDRNPGVDFRVPTAAELDAMEVFQLSLGRTEEVEVNALTFRNASAELGKELFFRMDTQGGTLDAGKCALCHFNAGANVDPSLFGALVAQFGLPAGLFGNFVFGTGVSDAIPNRMEEIAPGVAPRDGGIGILSNGIGECLSGQFDISGPFPVFLPTPGNEPGGFGGQGVAPFFVQGACLEQFNTPPLIEAADTGPFFHNNAFDTLEEAIAFYGTPEFNNVNAVQLFMGFTDSGRIAIQLQPDSVAAIGKFLRVLNSLENLRQSTEFDEASLTAGNNNAANQLLNRAIDELKDARKVLHEVGLHPVAVAFINTSIALNQSAKFLPWHSPARQILLNVAVDFMAGAKDLMVVESS